MPRVRLAAVPLLAGLLPLTAGALGLGEITLRSALNQPFVAEIPVTAESADELNKLSVQLAPAAAFERFGLDRPRFLDDLTFQVQREGSRAVVRVTSTQPVSEPFISLLLDVGWPQGRLLREYTVLLDPPAFAGGEQAAPAPAPLPPAAAGPSASAPVIRRAAPTDPVPAAAPAAGTVVSGPAGDTYGPVRSNETLWGISERLRTGSNASLNQMMVALYRANPEAFAGNINRLRRGAILRVPGSTELSGISSRDAASEVRRQDEAWRAAAGLQAPEQTPAPARLQLVPPSESAGSVPDAGTGPDGKAALERELAEQQRLLSLKDSQLKALQDRVSQLEGRATPPPVAEPAPAPAVVAPSAPPAAPSAGEALQPDAAEPVPAVPPATDVAATAQAPDQDRKPAKRVAREREKDTGGVLGGLTALISSVWFLVSAAAVLLAGLFFVFARRRMATADPGSDRFGNDLRGDMLGGAASTQPLIRRDGYSVEEGAADRTQTVAAPGRAAGRDGDSETPLERTISTEGAVELDQADVIAEADFHMAYGLYDQAAELLTRALRDSPDRRDLRLKLLEVYFIWENKAAFLKEAQVFQRQLKGEADPDWNKVVIMGKQICPGEALFAGAVGATGAVGLDLGTADDRGGVDISFDEGEPESLDLDLTAARQGPAADLLDFDIGGADDIDLSLDDTSMMKTGIAPRDGSSVEGPTVEAPYGGDYSPTMETPTIESRGLGASTMETPTLETPTVETAGAGTLETPTLESAVPGLRPGAADPRRAAGGGDQTEEINLEDLGLDLTGLDEAAGDLGTGLHDALDSDALDSADGSPSGDYVFDIGSPDDDASDLLEGLDADSTAEMRGMSLDEGTLDLPAFGNAMQKSAAAREGAPDASSDTAEHRVVEDTAEQPRVAANGLGESSAELSQVDFDIGDDKSADLEPTSIMTGRRRGPEGPTMTEVGTKLDLARAYVDMGDPDGARSILNEVLEEGDSSQRQEARRLLDDLTD